MKRFIPILLLYYSFVSCSGTKESMDLDKNPGKEYISYSISMPQYVFGFIGQNRYSYCPSVVSQGDGSSHIFFCGTPEADNFIDNVYHIVEKEDGNVSKEISVLQPSLDWDSMHTCDPSVIEGDFSMSGKKYKYAMFFLSNPKGFYYNEIGVAFSNDLSSGTWVKYPKQIVEKTWSGNEDQIIGGGSKSWGVGQPSAVSLDKKGKVLLSYTKGDIGGTCLMWRELDMSNMENFTAGVPRTMVSKGMYQIDGKTNDIGSNADIAVNIEDDKIVIVRPVRPFSNVYPEFIASTLEVLYMDFSDFINLTGEWKSLIRINPEKTSFPRNHNAGIKRDSFGHISNWETPEIYFTVSKEAPDVEPSFGKHAEWTYHIYKTALQKKVFTK